MRSISSNQAREEETKKKEVAKGKKVVIKSYLHNMPKGMAYRFSAELFKRAQPETRVLNDGENENDVYAYDSDLEVEAKSIGRPYGKPIGQGTYGWVRKLKISDANEFVVKAETDQIVFDGKNKRIPLLESDILTIKNEYDKHIKLYPNEPAALFLEFEGDELRRYRFISKRFDITFHDVFFGVLDQLSVHHMLGFMYKMALELGRNLHRRHKHRPGMIHGDFKPSNVMIFNKDGDDSFESYVRFIDLGEAAYLDGKAMRKTFGGGGALHWAPELLTKSRVTEIKPCTSQDVYSFCFTFLKYFKIDFYSLTSAEKEKRDRILDYPSVVKDILRQGLSVDPSQRPSFGKIIEVIEGVFLNFNASCNDGSEMKNTAATSSDSGSSCSSANSSFPSSQNSSGATSPNDSSGGSSVSISSNASSGDLSSSATPEPVCVDASPRFFSAPVKVGVEMSVEQYQFFKIYLSQPDIEFSDSNNKGQIIAYLDEFAWQCFSNLALTQYTFTVGGGVGAGPILSATLTLPEGVEEEGDIIGPLIKAVFKRDDIEVDDVKIVKESLTVQPM